MLGRVLIKIWFPVLQILPHKKRNCFHSFNENTVILLCLLPRVAFTNRVSVDVFVLPLVFLYCLRMMQHCCCLPLIEVFVCDGEKRWSHQTLTAAANPAHWRFILSFHLPTSLTSRMRDGTQVHSRGWLMTRGGAFHMRLACPWKLMVRGSFALDMYLWGLGKWLVALPCTKKAERPASLP